MPGKLEKTTLAILIEGMQPGASIRFTHSLDESWVIVYHPLGGAGKHFRSTGLTLESALLGDVEECDE